MNTGKRHLFAALACTAALLGRAATADEVRLYGAASLAMGGAHVAITDGAEALYANPAALGVLPGWDVALPLIGGGWLQHNGLLADLSEIEEMLGPGARFSDLDAEQKARVAAILQGLADGPAGGSASASAGVAAKLQNFGLALLGRTSGGVDLGVDTERLGTGGAGAADALQHNRSAMNAATLSTLELRAGYAHSLFPLSTRHQLYAGGALRLLRGWTSNFHTSVQELGDEDRPYYPELWKSSSSPSWGVDLDLGLLYCLGTLARAGLVLRGVLDPDFAVEPEAGYEGPQELSLGRQARVGFGLTPGAGFRIAADLDLTSNRTSLSRIEDRQLGFGVEKAIGGAFALRAGVMDNLAQPTGLTMTTGVRWSNLDLTLAYSPRDGMLSSDQVGIGFSYHVDRLTRPPGY